MSDVSDVATVVLRERQGRDRGWWDRMHECIHPRAVIRLSWFRGTGEDFVRESETMATRGQRATHRLSPPVVSLHGTRAVVEMPASIEFRDVIGGVEADLASHTRLVYRLEKDNTGWQVVTLDCIYERDSLTPTMPGETPRVDRDELAGFREPYRFIGYYLASSGYDIPDDLYADDRPDEVEALYRRSFDWLREQTGHDG
ncbi:hypothetical protein GCM10022222_28350 [Amycolatopsis ultiminotia]|uniref:SnoaL-like domain-containing protein n=1 Tax=Amycolatopsis ultiminotia TaxID=543629 RepID=A0ABP6VXX2_9PSEU